MGATTPLGGDVTSTWRALLAGVSAVRELSEPWAATLGVRIGAEVAVEPPEEVAVPGGGSWRGRADRATRLALAALEEAWRDAGFTGRAGDAGQPEPERVAVVIGTGGGGLETLLATYDRIRAGDGRRVSPFAVPMLMTNASAATVASVLGAAGVARVPAAACASGADAVGAGLDLIRSGRADVVVAGGTESILHPAAIAAFDSMRALSRNNACPRAASRPFDKKRDGFVLGDGSALVVLESRECAARRGARPYAELAGAGFGVDTHDVVRPDPSGRGMAQAMRQALADGRIPAGGQVHVNAHATATLAGDLAEAAAISSVLGARDYQVSAIKASTGHLVGAAGALSAVTTVLALSECTAPPTINLEDVDDDVRLDIVGREPRALPRRRLAALSNSAGFGGHNVCLAFRRLD